MISHDTALSLLSAPAPEAEGLTLRLQRAYTTCFPLDARWEKELLGVLRDTLHTPGGLARAHLVHGVMTGLGASEERAIAAAIALEYWHAASLILDDLPCMDDASERRGRPCAHTVHGESSALLGALALINQAYHLAWSAMEDCPSPARRRASALLSECLGAAGVLNGQALDLTFHQRDRQAQEVLSVADGKTGALLRLSLEWPALLAGVQEERTLTALRDLAGSWGRAYQILDDFKDCLESSLESGKTGGRDLEHGRPSLVVAQGLRGAEETLGREIRLGHQCLSRLESDHCAPPVLAERQRVFAAQADRLHYRLDSLALGHA